MGTRVSALTVLMILALFPGAGAAIAQPRENPVFGASAALEWLHARKVNTNSGLTEGPAVAPDGSIFCAGMPFGNDLGTIFRHDLVTRLATVFTENSGKSSGLAFPADGPLVELGIGHDAHSLFVTIDKGRNRLRVRSRGFLPHLKTQ